MLVMFLAGLAIIGLLYVLVYSTALQMKEVVIEGNKLVPENEIWSGVMGEMIREHRWKSLFGPNHKAFWVFGKTPDIQRLIPNIKTIELEKELGKGRLVIHIKERKVEGVWCFGEINCYVFDEEGILFARSPDVSGTFIIKIQDDSTSYARLNTKIVEDAEFQNIKTTIEDAEKAGFHARKVTIKSEKEEWWMETIGGTLILFNIKFKPKGFVEVIKTFLKKNSSSRPSQIDFRVPDKAYYK